MRNTGYGVVAALLAISLLGGAQAIADFRKGQNVWSKHVETNLLAEPGPLAGTQATVGFAEKLSIKEVQGAWLRVKSRDGEGWVFQGNVSGEKPDAAKALKPKDQVKIIRLIIRKKNMSLADFKKHWLTNYVKLEKRLTVETPVLRVVANFAVPPEAGGNEPYFDGMEEIYLPTLEDFKAMLASAELAPETAAPPPS